MDARQKEQLVKLGGRQIRFDFPMAKLTTLGVGGQCQSLYEANNLKYLQRVIAYISEERIPYIVVGKGSNLLVKDEGFDGLVILLRGPLAAVEQYRIDDYSVLAGAGLPLVHLLNYCRQTGLGGLECFAGIPGTVGGAVAMNAGAFGEEFGSRIQEIYLITQTGDLVLRERSQLRFSYRRLETEKGAVIIRARLKLYPQSEETVAGLIVDYLKKRKERQPLEYPSAGSVFKNPPNDYAGKLIEDAGMKGKSVGGAMISNKHANFIVNTGGATAKDVLALLFLAQEQVRKKTGIELEPEIQVVGN